MKEKVPSQKAASFTNCDSYGDSCGLNISMKSGGIFLFWKVNSIKTTKIKNKWVLGDFCLLHSWPKKNIHQNSTASRLETMCHQHVSALQSSMQCFQDLRWKMTKNGWDWFDDFSTNLVRWRGQRQTAVFLLELRVPNISKQLREPSWWFSFNLSYTPVTKNFANPTFYVWCSEWNGHNPIEKTSGKRKVSEWYQHRWSCFAGSKGRALVLSHTYALDKLLVKIQVSEIKIMFITIDFPHTCQCCENTKVSHQHGPKWSNKKLPKPTHGHLRDPTWMNMNPNLETFKRPKSFKNRRYVQPLFSDGFSTSPCSQGTNLMVAEAI